LFSSSKTTPPIVSETLFKTLQTSKICGGNYCIVSPSTQLNNLKIEEYSDMLKHEVDIHSDELVYGQTKENLTSRMNMFLSGRVALRRAINGLETNTPNIAANLHISTHSTPTQTTSPPTTQQSQSTQQTESTQTTNITDIINRQILPILKDSLGAPSNLPPLTVGSISHKHDLAVAVARVVDHKINQPDKGEIFRWVLYGW
jgi:hypothetical protein